MNTKKVLLFLLPYWTPLIPPQGISHIKYYLELHQHKVKTVDVNIISVINELYTKYFNILKTVVAKNKLGNFYNIGHDVIRNHMLLHINCSSDKEYLDALKIIIYKTYFTNLKKNELESLKDLLNKYFQELAKIVMAEVDKEKPQVVGISVMRDTLASSLFAFKEIKSKYPEIITSMGGSIFSDHLRVDSPNFERFVNKAQFIDKIFIGEGQQLMLHLLEGKLQKNKKVYSLEDIKKDPIGFSELNVPDFSNFDLKSNYPLLALQGSKGCTNNCSFCNVKSYSGEYKEKDINLLYNEMYNLYNKWGYQNFFMNDALVNYFASKLAKKIVDSKMKFYWDGYLKVDEKNCNKDEIALWRAGGMYRVRMGVESGSAKVLNLMNKNIKIQDTKKILKQLSEEGIKTTTYWVIGHPGETEKDFQATLNLLEELSEYIYEAECNPFIYGYSGQGNTQKWKNKRVSLYPEKYNDLLILQSWKLNCSPSRAETYKRLSRFVEKSGELNIPNPYTQQEIYLADKRWKSLHKNAVPELALFQYTDEYVDESKISKKYKRLANTSEINNNFSF